MSEVDFLAQWLEHDNSGSIPRQVKEYFHLCFILIAVFMS